MEHKTLEQFEREYAERSGVTVEYLHQHGRYGAPCECGYELCEGWKMTHRDEPPQRVWQRPTQPSSS